MSWTEARKAVLRSAALFWPRGHVLVIGAAALEALRDFERATRDIDLIVRASIEDVATRLRDAGWERDETIPHRWTTPTGEPVDVIPAPPELSAAGCITWPDGRVMNLAGVDLAFRTAEEVPLGNGSSIAVASLSVQPLLKFAAYLDRPQVRTKDIADVVELFRNAFAIRDCDVEEIAEMQLDVELASAYTMGRRLGAMIGPAEAPAIHGFMRKARDPTDPDRTQGVIARCGRWLEEENDYEDVMPLFEAFMQGFERSLIDRASA